MRRSFLFGLAALGLGLWMGLCFLVIGDALPAEYKITRFQFGPHTYELSEPTIDWVGFKGAVTQVINSETFDLNIFEGSDAAGKNWLIVVFVVEKQGDGRKPVILYISVNENVTGDLSKIKSTNLYHQSYFETGKEDYLLKNMNPPPDFKKYIDGRLLGGRKLHI